jgi:DNA-binding response OmpR family regulator
MKQHLILIIDENSANRKRVGEYLTNFGYRIFLADNGEEGFAVMRKYKLALILLEVNVPGKDGFTILQEIKEDPDLSKIPVIFLTSYNRSNLKVKGLEMGAEDYITHPFDNAELLARIRVALRRHQPCQPGQKDDTIMEGNIKYINLVELLQTIELGKKDAEIDIPELDIQVILENGHIISCRFKDFRDHDALVRILLVDEGWYIVRFENNIQVKSEKRINVTQAIMELTAYLDEANSLFNRFTSWKQIKINDKLLQLKGAEHFEKREFVPLKHFIIALHGELKENLQKVWKMFQENKIELKSE